jgi:hypothetical protein
MAARGGIWACEHEAHCEEEETYEMKCNQQAAEVRDHDSRDHVLRKVS